MSNGYKAGRVFDVFGVQLQDRIIIEESHFHFFLTDVHFIPVFSIYFPR
jgi:hypothetical protein